MFSPLLITHVLLLTASTFAAPPRRANPTVALDQGIFTGTFNSTTGTNNFLGIPFAQPPVGDLRLRLPVANSPYNGSYDTATFGDACITQSQDSSALLSQNLTGFAYDSLISLLSITATESEDCLHLNVWQPANTPKGAKLPIVAWIYGGGFQSGSTNMYNGASIVQKSIQLGKPIIFVSMNYRLSAFGFLASQEVKDAGVGNIGIHDQRLALQWIQKYIPAFGGDPTKVTIWGESAGAISVAIHMLVNNGNNQGLFRGAFMDSGFPNSLLDITHGQGTYDTIVSQTGCQGSTDTLQCLRTVPVSTLQNVINDLPNLFSPESLNITWVPRADGTFLMDNPQQLVLDGKVANVPFVAGDCDDEGTLFTFSLLNITTEQQVRDYWVSNYMPDITTPELNKLLTFYPQNVTQGSPFGTGTNNAVTPQFKRLAALQGDLLFQAPRRFFLQQRSGKQNAWSYLSKRFKDSEDIGSAHGTDLIITYQQQADLAGYLVNFVNNLNPNGGNLPNWPRYTNSSPQLLTLLDGSTPITITQDNYRQSALAFLEHLEMEYPM